MKILVTGGGGFLGRHIITKLIEHGADKEDLFAPSSKELDLRLFENCRRAVEGRELVIHAAGITGNAEFHRLHPGLIFYENAMMGIQLIEASRVQGVKKVITIGSAAEYPADAVPPFCEEGLWAGFPELLHAPYAMAKKMFAVQEAAYREEYGLASAHLLMTGMYGPGAKKDSGPIPSWIDRIAVAKRSGADSIMLWGTGKPTRDFLYVEDAAEAIVLAAEKYNDSMPVNIGSGREVSIREAAEILVRLMDFKGKLLFDPTKPDGQMCRSLDVSNAEQRFDFRAATSLESGLQKTIEWYNGQI